MSFFLSGIPILDTQDIGDSLPYINKAFFDLDTQIALLCAGGREFATLASMVSTTNGDSTYFLTKYVNSIAENYLVYLDGVKQIPNVDYTVNSATSSIVFQAQLPPSNITLEVMTAVAVVSYIDDQYKLPLAGGTLTGGLVGTTATFSSSVSAPAVRGSHYGNLILGSNSVAGNNILIQNGLVQSLSGSFGDRIVVNDAGSLRLRYGNLILDGSNIANPYGTINTGGLTFANGLYSLSDAGVITARSGTFIASLSAPALSGAFFGDGSRLTGVGTANALSLSGGTLVGPLTGTRATFTTSISAPAFYGDGSKLTGILTNATTSVVTEVIISTAGQSIFDLSTTTYTPSTNNIAVFWDGIKLLAGRDYSETDGNTITLAQPANAGSYFLFEVGKLITRSDALSGTTATFASVSSTYYYGDGSKLTGIITAATTSIVSPEVIISTAGQTVFNLSTITYAPSTNNIAVYWDGIKLLAGRDYSETDGNTITLAQPANAGSYLLFEVGKLITRSDALSGTTATFASISSTYYYGDGSRLTGIGGGTANALPLSGGTLTGGLTGTTARFTSNMLVSGSITVPVGSYLNFSTNGNGHTAIYRNGSANGMEFLAVSASRMFIADAGNVGIGNITPNSKLTVSGDISASGFIYGNGSMLSGITTDTTKLLPLSGGTMTGNLILSGATGVGIGTSTLSQYTKLEINGTGITQAKVKNTTSIGDASWVAENTLGIAAFGVNGVGPFVYTSSGLPVSIYTNGSERMRILSGGNIGIGTTTPSSKLHVDGDIRVPAGGRLFLADTNNDTSILRDVGNNGIALDTASITRLFIGDNGNVGIGTTAPTSKMHVVGTSRLQGDVTITGNLSCAGTQTFFNTVFTTTSAVSVVNFGSGAALYVGNNGSGDIASFYDIDANVEVLHVGGNTGTFPNVGIKTSAPTKTLTVAGEISATQDITTSGNLNAVRGTFTTSISAPALSGAFYGDGSNLTNLDASKIASGTLSAARLPAIATFSTSISAPALSGAFYGDGRNLHNLDAGDIVFGTLSAARLPAIATFSTSISAPALSGTFYGDGSKLTGVNAAGPPVYAGKSGTYTLSAADINSVISFNSSALCYLRIPSDATNIPIGSQFTVIQEGLGNVVIQIVPSSGVSLQSYGSMYTTTGQYAMATLIKVAASTWRLGGTLS